MRDELFDFQKDACYQLRAKLAVARSLASVDNPQVVSFSAPTGSGKTVILVQLFEEIFYGQHEFPAQPDAIILWISDLPELNEQTRRKIEAKSDRIRVSQLVTIDSSYDAEYLAGGHVYFLNTQKLGSDKILTQHGDGREYTIWETLTNTALSFSGKFYVVIDEAHRGMNYRNQQQIEEARTIMQRFLLGSREHGLSPMPIVIGVSATPTRFESLLSGTTHTVHKVYVGPEEVRESGLLKDRILIHHPGTSSQVGMTLLGEAVHRWMDMQRRWARYCKDEGEGIVKPVLVIQVEDKSESTPTKTDLDAILETVENAIGRALREDEVRHCFSDTGQMQIGGRKVSYIEPSRIQDDPDIGIVFFKMNLSTGWDCPRAEVMMSFRNAQDYTYIAQLLGRMVRTPLARRIERDAALNDVHLFLPYYDADTVSKVISALRNAEDVPPSEAGLGNELVTLTRRNGTDEVFEALKSLVTYRVDKVRKQSALSRLVGLARGLVYDKIDENALREVKIKIISKIDEEVERLKDEGVFDDLCQQIVGTEFRTIVVEHGMMVSEGGEYSVELVLTDIERRFKEAGQRLGNGLHVEYWKAHSDDDHVTSKLKVIIITQDYQAMKNIEDFTEVEFNRLYQAHKRRIADLREQRRRKYERLALSGSSCEPIPWILPESISLTRSPNSKAYDKHLYVEADGQFRIELGTWEKEVLEIELRRPSTRFWLRNVDRKPWALEIPYRVGADTRSMYPDLVIIHQGVGGYEFDILEPHDPSRKDNISKILGLAEFAQENWHLFRRIELIRKMRGADGVERYYGIDVADEALRRRVLEMTSNAQLDTLFEDAARPL